MKKKYPVYPVLWKKVLKSFSTYERQNIEIEPILHLTLMCAVRAWYGNFWRATWAVAWYGITRQWMQFKVEMNILWYRLRGFNDTEIENALLGEYKCDALKRPR